MSWNGSGVFSPAITFVPNTPATAEDQNTQDVDIAAGITNCIAKDGQNAAIANIPMGGNKITGLANGTVTTDAAAFGQLSIFMPPGVVLPYAGSSAPSGFLLCNGGAVSRTTYAALFGIIGTQFGTGDGSTTFNVPNVQGRTIAGLDPSGSTLSTFSMSPNGNTVGATGGAEGHVVIIAELPPHNHTAAVSDPGHTHVYEESFQSGFAGGGSGALGYGGNVPASDSAATTGIAVTIGLTGSANQHLNVQPTILMYHIIKT